MNPNHDEQPNLSLPSPSMEGMPINAQQEGTSVIPTPEVGHQPIQSIPPVTLPPAMPSIPTVPPEPPSVTAPSSVDPSATTNPVIADDNDLIEKEWVEKAKAIVAKTKDDPFIQSKEVNYFKADYMKKRYNKDIKLAPE